MPTIVLDGSTTTNSAGLDVNKGTTVRGLVFSNWPTGISLWSESVLQCSYVGTDVTGTVAAPNLTGVLIGSFGNTVGGTEARYGNVISGNDRHGVDVTGDSNVIQGNRIGTDVSGLAALPNGDPCCTTAGISVRGHDNLIGGTVAAARNIVSANTQYGISLEGGSSDNVVQGNYIGVDATGNAALGNGASGVTECR